MDHLRIASISDRNTLYKAQGGKQRDAALNLNGKNVKNSRQRRKNVKKTEKKPRRVKYSISTNRESKRHEKAEQRREPGN